MSTQQMMERLREFKWAAMIGASVSVFLFSTFATMAQVNQIVANTKEEMNIKHLDVLDRVKDIQETVHRLDERLYNRKR